MKTISKSIVADRQGAKRHYGVHPYFTRRPYNVVQTYIEAYSLEQSLVADPFGGSGVVAIEAFLSNRTGIQNDINPLANFVAEGIAELKELDTTDFRGELREITADWSLDENCQNWLPDNIRLPSNSDVDTYHELFEPQQLRDLAQLWSRINIARDEKTRHALRLAFSATLAKTNRTFLSAEGRAESRGGSSIFSIYRYKVAKNPVVLPVLRTFLERAQNIRAAAHEIQQIIEHRNRTTGFCGRFIAEEFDIEEFAERYRGKLDYIFTDPPYGGHISYLDLSTLWNNWLFGEVPEHDLRSREMIVGGELKLSEENYVLRLKQSISSCVKTLRQNCWLSVVFQHWNVKYFEAILEGAASAGAGLRAAISQIGDPIWSMHKKKNHDNVLAGEMILTFQQGHRVERSARDFSVSDEIAQIVYSAKGALFSEAILNELVIRAWQARALDRLDISPEIVSGFLQESGFKYDSVRHNWIRQPALIDIAPLFG